MKKNWILLPLSVIIIGCGSDSTTSTTKGSIDISTYLESKSTSKNYQEVNKDKGEAQSRTSFTEESIVTTNKVERRIKNVTDSIITISESKVTKNDISTEGNVTTAFKRYVDVNATLFLYDINVTKPIVIEGNEVGTQDIKGTRTCKLVDNLDGFTHMEYTFTGDIVKVKCTKDVSITRNIKSEFIDVLEGVDGSTVKVIDIFYMYSKKSTGLIAKIDDDCSNEQGITNDASTCPEENQSYEYTYFVEN